MPQPKKGKPHRFPTTYDYKKVLVVLSKTEEKRTSVIKDDLAFKDQLYEKPSKKWYNEALQKLESAGFVERHMKRNDPAYYWKLTKLGEIEKEKVECVEKEE